MSKIRVHQLAKELGIDSKDIIEEAAKHGIQVKNHMSSLSDSDEFMLRAFLETLKPPPPKEEKKPVPMPDSERQAAGAIRVSLGLETTKEDVLRFADTWLAKRARHEQRAA